jgi:MATE family multidrug resistance protein
MTHLPVTFDRNELRSMMGLAFPLMLAELGWMAMGIVDTMFVGRVSAEAIGAVSVGTTVYHTIALFAGGLLLGLDTLVSQAAGARDREDCRRSLVNGIWLALFLVPVVMGAVWLIVPALGMAGVNSAVLAQTRPYMRALNWSTAFLLVFFVLRRYLQSFAVARPIMFTLIAANLVNIAGNWIFVLGNLGAPRLGAEGSGWATFFSRLLMMTALIAVTWRHERGLIRLAWRVNLLRIRKLLRLGIPAAAQVGLEFTVWTVATVLAGRFAADVLAGHQIALMTVTTTYMMPLGVSSAAAVRVGHAIGRDDRRGAARSGWAAVGLGSVAMSASAIALLAFPNVIARLFTPDAAVIATAVPILRIAAFFQLFDGFQVVTMGALRGAGDTHSPALCHFAGYWLIGLPVGVWLAFGQSAFWQPMSAMGLWIGLSTGVIAIGTVLLWLWRRKADSFARLETPASKPSLQA